MHSSTRENYCASQENSTFQENYLSPTWDEGRVDQGTRPVVLWKKVCFSPKTKQTLAIVACAMNDKAARSCTGNLVAAGNDRVPLTNKNSVKRCRVARNRDWAAVTASLCILAHVAQSCCTQAARMLKSRSSTCMWSARCESGSRFFFEHLRYFQVVLCRPFSFL